MRSALAAALLAGCAATSAPTQVEGADPDALFAGGRMWIYPTGPGDRLDVWSSADRRHWSRGAPLLHLADIGWARSDRAPKHYLWAPDMVADGGRWLLYYSIGPQNPTPSRIGVALCRGPAGPCRDSGRPLLTGGDGFEAIDPMVFADARSGRRLLYAGGSAGARLRVFELAPTMAAIARELRVDQPPGFTEGAFVHARGGTYYLSYSHGHWNRADYSVRYATGPAPTGPWTYRGTILSSEGRYKGPGHHSFVRGSSGEWLIVYHRWENQPGNGPFRGERQVAIAPVRYDAAGLIQPIRMEPSR